MTVSLKTIKNFIPFTIVIVMLQCSSTSKEGVKSAQFQACIDTFKDETKCKELVEKTTAKTQEQDVSQEEFEKILKEKNLLSRENLLDLLPGQNKLQVKKVLGEPDQFERDGGGHEYYIYSRPLSLKKGNSRPDKEIKVVFKRDFVVKVRYLPPD